MREERLAAFFPIWGGRRLLTLSYLQVYNFAYRQSAMGMKVSDLGESRISCRVACQLFRVAEIEKRRCFLLRVESGGLLCSNMGRTKIAGSPSCKFITSLMSSLL